MCARLCWQETQKHGRTGILKNAQDKDTAPLTKESCPRQDAAVGRVGRQSLPLDVSEVRLQHHVRIAWEVEPTDAERSFSPPPKRNQTNESVHIDPPLGARTVGPGNLLAPGDHGRHSDPDDQNHAKVEARRGEHGGCSPTPPKGLDLT